MGGSGLADGADAGGSRYRGSKTASRVLEPAKGVSESGTR